MVILLGRGSIVVHADDDILELSGSVVPIHLVVDGSLCECHQVDFHAGAHPMLGRLMMTDCALVFQYKCGDTPKRTGVNNCSGWWE